MTLVRCEICGRTSEDPPTNPEWLRIERSAIVEVCCREPGPFDVCSVACLLRFAKTLPVG